jgi:hypothetical protein
MSTFKGLYTKSIVLDLPTNISLGWKNLTGTNNQAYYEDSRFVNYCRNNFYKIGPWLRHVYYRL